MGYTGDVYAHTGVNTNIDDWQHVIESWGNNATQPKLNRIGTDLYQLTIGNIREFYNSQNSSEVVNSLAFVFRNAGGNKQTENIFLPLYQNGLNVSIINPTERNLLVLLNEEIDVVVKSVDSDSLHLYLDETLLASTNSDPIGYTIIVGSDGDHSIIAKAFSNNEGYVTIQFPILLEEVLLLKICMKALLME